MVEKRCCQFRSHFMATHSSQSPQWSGCHHPQEWLCLPRRPPPPLREKTSLAWKERYLIELIDDEIIVLNFARSSWRHYCPMYFNESTMMLPQGVEVLPAVLAFLPRYARCLRVEPTARHKGVVDHREGVITSPFNDNYSEMRSRMRVYLVGGKVGSCRLHLRGRLQRLL